MRYTGKKGKCWEAVKARVRSLERDCYTCPSKGLVGANFGAGHYIPVALAGSNNTLSWDMRQIHAQCMRCNGVGQGMAVEYRAHLIKDYGEDFVKELEARRYKVDPVKNWDTILSELKSLRYSTAGKYCILILIGLYN